MQKTIYGNVINVNILRTVLNQGLSARQIEVTERGGEASSVILDALEFTGDHRFQYEPHMDVTGSESIRYHVYTIGESIYTPIKTITERNNAVAYILTYCDPYNIDVAPAESPVNAVFWEYLARGGASAASLSLAGNILPTDSELIQNDLEKIQMDVQLSDSEINTIEKLANQYLSNEECELAKEILSNYKKDNEKNKEAIEKIIKLVIEKMEEENLGEDTQILDSFKLQLSKEKKNLEKKDTISGKISNDDLDIINKLADKYLTGSEKVTAKNNINEYKNNYKDKSNKLTTAEKREYKQIIENVEDSIKKIIKGSNVNINVQNVVSASSNIQQEAKTFEEMWSEINSKYGGKYENSIKDLTNEDNIKVEYDATSKKYKVGPFKIDYLKKEYEGQQFGGMTGTPVLTLRKYNEITTLNRGDKWKIVKNDLTEMTYPDPKQEFYVLLDFTEGFNAITSLKFNFKYLTAEATFTISEGNVEKLDWCFQQSDEKGDYICSYGSRCDGGAGNNGGLAVDIGVETEHTSPQVHKHPSYNPYCTNNSGCPGHTGTKSCDVNSIEAGATCNCGTKKEDHGVNQDGSYNSTHTYTWYHDDDNMKDCPDWECKGHKCKGGRQCGHSDQASGPIYWPHYNICRFYLTVSVCDYENVQDTASVAEAKVGFEEINWWVDGSGSGTVITPNGAPGSGGNSLELSWYIDLTTTMAGNVWEETDWQKAANSNGTSIGTRDASESGNGLKNIAITVKLYDEDGKFVDYAIPHDLTGAIDIEQTRKDKFTQNGTYETEKKEPKNAWPKYTDENGYYEINRLEAPGPGGGDKDKNKNNLFYVIEFEYDGQTYRHTVFMANQTSGNNNVADEGKSSDYTAELIDKKDETKGIKADKYKNSSMAVEEIDDRYKFDQKFGEITGNTSINDDKTTEGIIKTTNEAGEISNNKEDKIKYKGKSTDLIAGETAEDNKRIESTLDKPFTDDSNKLSDEEFGRTPAKVSDLAKDETKDEHEKYRMVASTYYNDTDVHGIAITKEDYRIQYPLEGWKYIMNNKTQPEKKDNVTGKVIQKSKRYINEYMLHINLGLQKRKEADISILQDLYKMTVVVNNQKLVKRADRLGNNSEKNYAETVIELEKSRANGYQLGLYNSDVAYLSSNRYKNAISEVQTLKEKTELRVFVTYKTKVFNNSDTNDVEINEITNYYDPTYTLLNEKIEAQIINENMKFVGDVIADAPYYRIVNSGNGRDYRATKAEDLDGYGDTSGDVSWIKLNDTVSAGGKNYSVAKLNELSKMKLKIGEAVEIFTTYEVDQEGYMRASAGSDVVEERKDKLCTDKENIVEVSNYSTYYSAEDSKFDAIVLDEQSNPQRSYYIGYKEGWISGKVDKDSAPNNIYRNNILDRKNYEDDTFQSTGLKISMKTYEREMYGYVWEDEKTENVTTKDGVNVKVGDGQYQDGEKLIPNVKVSMYEVINLTGIDSKYTGLEYYYKIPNEYYSDDENKITKDSKIVLNNVNGNNNTINGNYYLNGFLAGDYVIRFDYGTTADEGDAHENWDINEDGHLMTTQNKTIKYNGQDYENTRFLGENTTQHLNDKYLDLGVDMDGQAISKARDNESRRMVVDSYSRYVENERGEILRNRRADNTEYVEATKMFAETPVMQVEVEDPKRIVESEVPGGRGNSIPNNSIPANVEKTETPGENEKTLTDNIDQKYTMQNINFGLEKRAETDIVLEQYVNNIYLLKNNDMLFSAAMDENGKVIMNSENAKNLDKLTYMAHERQQQGFYALNVEDDYLNGLSLSIKYKIKVINNSEIDYTGFLAGQYSAEDIRKLASRTPTTALYDNIIDSLQIDGNAEDANKTGISSNATLQEVQSLLGINPPAGADKTDTIRPEIIIYGKYVGRFYYENIIHEKKDSGETGQSQYTITNYSSDKNAVPQTISYVADNVVETAVEQLVDYIDVNTSLDEENSVDVQDCSWVLTSIAKEKIGVDLDRDGKVDKDGTEDKTIKTITDLNGLISNASYRAISEINDNETDLYDEKGRQLVTGTGSNVAVTFNDKIEKKEETVNGLKKYRMEYNKHNSGNINNAGLITEMKPVAYTKAKVESSRIEYVVTRKNVTSGMDADEMNIDNLVEVLVYSNPTGRRDVNSVPGNAMVIGTEKGMWKAGYNSINVHQNEVGDNWELVKTNWRLYPENDANATEFITVIPPTGIAIHDYVTTRIVPIVILTTSAMLLMGIFIIKQHQIKK